MIARSLVLGLLLGLAQTAHAVDLTLPASARQTAGEELGLDSYGLPIAPFDGQTIPVRTFEGYVSRQAWRIEGAGVTPLQVLQPLRDELKENGYTVVFECADRSCGGFDFRFGTEVIDVPDMYVNLDDYRFLAAVRGKSDAPSAALSLLISRSASAAYVQVIQIAVDKKAGISIAKGSELVASTKPETGRVDETPKGLASLPKQLEIAGHVILNDLEFKTGSSELGIGPFNSLAQVADYLRQNPERRIALVGHTDAQGSLDGNISLSRKRAISVQTRLIEAHGVAAAQLTAEGVGYLAPVATNLTTPGRDANRRVEAVVISTK